MYTKQLRSGKHLHAHWESAWHEGCVQQLDTTILTYDCRVQVRSWSSEKAVRACPNARKSWLQPQATRAAVFASSGILLSLDYLPDNFSRSSYRSSYRPLGFFVSHANYVRYCVLNRFPVSNATSGSQLLWLSNCQKKCCSLRV